MYKEIRKMSTCDRLDLETLGSLPLIPKNLPDTPTLSLLSSNLAIIHISDITTITFPLKTPGSFRGQLYFPLPPRTPS